MAKKDFKINNAVDKFFTQPEQEEQNTQSTPNTQDTQNTQETRRHKHPRINMAFYDDHLEYLQIISRVKGISITQYVNDLIALDKEKNQELINQAKQIFK